MKKPTIKELEALLNSEHEIPMEILPNGEIRMAKRKRGRPKKVLTFQQDLGGEY